MKEISLKKIDEFGYIVNFKGIVFEANYRQFAIEQSYYSYNIIELYSGCRVLWFQKNDLLPFSIDNMIEFAKTYIRMITDEQFENGIQRLANKFSDIEFPVNKTIKL